MRVNREVNERESHLVRKRVRRVAVSGRVPPVLENTRRAISGQPDHCAAIQAELLQGHSLGLGLGLGGSASRGKAASQQLMRIVG